MATKPAVVRKDASGPANLVGRIAVVTGGSQGLGEAIAGLFAGRGAAGIVICGRNAANGERVAAEISAGGRPTHFVRADLADAGRGSDHEDAPRRERRLARGGRQDAPFGRLIDPKEVARACAYLASSESGLMTGSNIDFDQNVVGAGDPPLEP